MTHVQHEKRYVVGWRFISLEIVNEKIDRPPERQAMHQAGMRALRVADQVRLEHGNDAVAAYYIGARAPDPHRQAPRRAGQSTPPRSPPRRSTDAGLVAAHGRPRRRRLPRHPTCAPRPSWRCRAPDRMWVRRSSRSRPARASARAASSGRSSPRRPRGADAVRLWDAIEVTRHLRRRRAQAQPPRQARVRLTHRSECWRASSVEVGFFDVQHSDALQHSDAEAPLALRR